MKKKPPKPKDPPKKKQMNKHSQQTKLDRTAKNVSNLQLYHIPVLLLSCTVLDDTPSMKPTSSCVTWQKEWWVWKGHGKKLYL